MKRPLRDRTMGAVREGRGDPSPYSIVFSDDYAIIRTDILRFSVI